MGSVVFPDAALKVYLDASIGVRAERRHKQFPEFSEQEYRDRIETRDRLDSTREDSPLTRTSDAVWIDTTGLTIEEVVQEVIALAGERLDKGDGPG
jgi:cytidylate kinase